MRADNVALLVAVAVIAAAIVVGWIYLGWEVARTNRFSK